tara:strand:- start:685 stop:816 length:132 start_codon:yes stop_codon:yes gene_type:complete
MLSNGISQFVALNGAKYIATIKLIGSVKINDALKKQNAGNFPV